MGAVLYLRNTCWGETDAAAQPKGGTPAAVVGLKYSPECNKRPLGLQPCESRPPLHIHAFRSRVQSLDEQNRGCGALQQPARLQVLSNDA